MQPGFHWISLDVCLALSGSFGNVSQSCRKQNMQTAVASIKSEIPCCEERDLQLLAAYEERAAQERLHDTI